VLDRSTDYPCILILTSVSGLKDLTRHGFIWFDVSAILPASVQCCLRLMHAGFPIGFVVEGRDNDVSPFVPVWVVPVVVATNVGWCYSSASTLATFGAQTRFRRSTMAADRRLDPHRMDSTLVTRIGITTLVSSCSRHCTLLGGRFSSRGTVIAETGYLLGARGGVRSEALFLRSLAEGTFHCVPFEPADFVRIAELVETYSHFPLGTTDASVIAVAKRLNVTEIATVDHRHFAAVQPRHADALTLFPRRGDGAPGRRSGRPCSHQNRRSVLVLSGKLEILDGSRTFVIGPGDFVFMP
jgi:uncharacterized protein